MKTFFVSIAILALTATISFAHIGETESECETRYGKPISGDKHFARFEKDGIIIEIIFDVPEDEGGPDADAANRGMTDHGRKGQEGKAIKVVYLKEGYPFSFSADEVKALLAANAGPDAATWRRVKRKKSHEDYRRSDGRASARVYWNFTGGADTARKVRVELSANLSADE